MLRRLDVVMTSYYSDVVMTSYYSDVVMKSYYSDVVMKSYCSDVVVLGVRFQTWAEARVIGFLEGLTAINRFKINFIFESMLVNITLC